MSLDEKFDPAAIDAFKLAFPEGTEFEEHWMEHLGDGTVTGKFQCENARYEINCHQGEGDLYFLGMEACYELGLDAAQLIKIAEIQYLLRKSLGEMGWTEADEPVIFETSGDEPVENRNLFSMDDELEVERIFYETRTIIDLIDRLHRKDVRYPDSLPRCY